MSVSSAIAQKWSPGSTTTVPASVPSAGSRFAGSWLSAGTVRCQPGFTMSVCAVTTVPSGIGRSRLRLRISCHRIPSPSSVSAMSHHVSPRSVRYFAVASAAGSSKRKDGTGSLADWATGGTMAAATGWSGAASAGRIGAIALTMSVVQVASLAARSRTAGSAGVRVAALPRRIEVYSTRVAAASCAQAIQTMVAMSLMTKGSGMSPSVTRRPTVSRSGHAVGSGHPIAAASASGTPTRRVSVAARPRMPLVRSESR